MKFLYAFLLLLALSVSPAFGQCGTLVVNPTTSKLDCIGTSGGGGSNQLTNGGTISGTINMAGGTLSGGTLSSAAITGGTISGTINMAGGTLSGGTLNSPTITGGTISGTIGGNSTFSGNIVTSQYLQPAFLLGTINASSATWGSGTLSNITIAQLSGVSTNSGTLVNTAGTISGGTLAGTVNVAGTLSGGTLAPATLSGTVANAGTLSGGSLGGTINATGAMISIGSGSTATTQSADDNSTKLATTAYVDRLNKGPAFAIANPTTSFQAYWSPQATCSFGTWRAVNDAGTVTWGVAKVSSSTPPTAGNSIISTGTPPSSSANVNSGSSYTNWTATSTSAGDTFLFYISAVTGSPTIASLSFGCF